ncbi:hypothetical protein [Microvirga antarctica]|uniref:hypothetical protein n=1 Tax=Microvirga antarctica TaxID=2819233 RepID=UPI001B304C3B|nr:hypothetical protein [Microvirga antarctica]
MTIGVSQRGWKRTAMAVALAYALVLQGLLLALGGATHAHAAGSPQTALCLPGAQTGSAGSPHESGQADHALCCLLGCGAVTVSAGPPPVVSSLRERRPILLSLGTLPAPHALPVASAVLPVGSRAPPRLA